MQTCPSEKVRRKWAEYALSTRSLCSCSRRKRKTPYPNTKQPQLRARNMRVREKPWPAFPALVEVVQRKEGACEESPGWASERKPDCWGLETAMNVAQKTGLLSEPKRCVRLGVSLRLLQTQRCQVTFRGPALTPVRWLEREREEDGGSG